MEEMNEPGVGLALVVTYGRSGSTLLMQGMARHPDVLMARYHPFEHRIAQYLLAARDANAEVDGMCLELGGASIFAARPRDWRIRLALGLASRKRLFGVGATPDAWTAAEAVYRAVCRGRPGRRAVILEKSVGLAFPQRIRAAWPWTRLVVLLRDPRSVFFSVKAFNRRRGYLSFGEEEGEEALFRRIVQFSTVADAQASAGSALRIRYEDLVVSPRREVERLLGFCALDPGFAEQVCAGLERQGREARSHMTTALADSLERWRSDAGPQHAELFSRYEKQLDQLGYPVR
jgi:hypothetical protein